MEIFLLIVGALWLTSTILVGFSMLKDQKTIERLEDLKRKLSHD